MQSSILMWLIIHSVAIDILGLIILCGDVARSLMPFECFSICDKTANNEVLRSTDEARTDPFLLKSNK